MISEMNFFERIVYILQNYGISYLKGAGTTLLIALVSTAIGCVIGFAVGIVQTIPVDKKRMDRQTFFAGTCQGDTESLCGDFPWYTDDRAGSLYLLRTVTDVQYPAWYVAGSISGRFHQYRCLHGGIRQRRYYFR